jgi:putative ABC transport system permease protein
MRHLPTWAERFLRAICPDELVDQIAGDLVELYNHDSKVIGERKAKVRLLLTTLRFFRPGILLRNKFSMQTSQTLMIGHYIKTTCRHFIKGKLNFSFKVAGLALALMCFLVIVIYVSYQMSFDRYHEDFQNVYRVNSQRNENGEIVRYASVSLGIGPILKSNFPEVKAYTRLGGASRYIIRVHDKSFQVEGIADADSTIFDVFSFKFVKGDKRALRSPKSIVLTEAVVKQIFGNEDPMGKSISVVDRSDVSLQVTGVIEDLPGNTHLRIRALTSFSALADSFDGPSDPWDVSSELATTVYVRLDGRSNPEVFTANAQAEIQKRIRKGENGEEKDFAIMLQSLKDIYLDTPVYAEFVNKGNVVYVYVFSVLGFFLLLISSINYVNLSIADFHKRRKEIGVRKVMGARKKQIAFQVVLEAVLILSLSLIISVAALYFLFPQVLQIFEPNLKFTMLIKPEVLITVSVIIAVLIVLSTAYPAYKLGVNNPIHDLKSGDRKYSSISNILLLSQFTISVICICATFIVAKQLEFIQTRNPGYDRQNLIVVHMPDRYPPEKDAVIKDEFLRLVGVDAVSYSTFRIAGAGYYRDWYRVEIDGAMKPMLLNEVFFDHDFFQTTGIPLVAGRGFDPARITDSHEAFIVNETAVREFGWTDPIGKRMSYGAHDIEGEKWEGTVVGVVKDFNVYSLHKKIEPLVMRLPWSEWPGSCVHIRVNGPLEETIARIKKKFEEILPGYLLSYVVVDDLYHNQYQNERKAYTTLYVSTWIIVLISSLGIFSLSLYMSVTRMKEFGIRKVLGATASQITLLHAGKFVKIALIANAIALPFAYIITTSWLEQFAYKTTVSSLSFFIVGVFSLVLVLLSAGWSAWRSGKMNPIEVIKTE